MKNKMILGKWLIGLTMLLFMCFFNSVKDERVESKLPIKLSINKGTNSELIIFLTGDGGWNKFSKNLLHEFEQQGYGVVSLNSLIYFRNEKTPEDLANDIELISEYYLKEWNKTSLIIVGYSFGADAASFLPGKLSVHIKEKIKKLALLSPSASTDFVVRISDLLGLSDNENGKFKVQGEIENSKLPVICIFGKEEELLLKEKLKYNDKVLIYEMPGGHRYNGNYKSLVQIIIS